MYLLVSECATNHSSNPLLGAKPSVHIRWRLTREKKGITFIGKVSWQIDFLTWSQDNGQDIAGWLCLSLNSPFSLSFTDQRRRVIKNSEVDPCAKTRGAKAPTPSLSLSVFTSPSLSHTCSSIKCATDGSGAQVHVFYHRLSHPLKRLRHICHCAVSFLVRQAHEPKHTPTHLGVTVKHQGENCN